MYIIILNYVSRERSVKLLSVENLHIDFVAPGKELPVVSGVSFAVEPGRILALVGESGCGKSISCLSLTGLLPSPPARIRADAIRFRHQDRELELQRLRPREMRKIRGGGIGYIFQEPAASLNPVFRIGDQIAEAIELHRPEIQDVRGEVIRLLAEVGIPAPETRIDAFPHELSGGMQQRVMIAMALAGMPALLIADEPTTALDVTIQAQILELIDRTRREKNMAVILVTHNLGIVSELADEVAVMYAGVIVESAPAREVIDHPRHPYTAALLAAVPRPGLRREKLTTIPGHVPPAGEYPAGCRFFGRCEHCDTLTAEQQERCRSSRPASRELTPHHITACHWPLPPTGETTP